MAFENNARGIDVSLWQGDVDWVALKAAGVDFAFTKATQGDNVTDPHVARKTRGHSNPRTLPVLPA